MTSSITPKSGNSFIGEHGAILDGTGWSTTDATQGAFRAWNQNIDDVTIRNLVIRNMPRGISTFYGPDRWTIDHNDVSYSQIGINHANSLALPITTSTTIANTDSQATARRCTHAGNEIAYNNTVSAWPGAMGGTKWTGTTNLTIRGNYFHGNYHNAIWLDTGPHRQRRSRTT